jgi:hypothetical protein
MNITVNPSVFDRINALPKPFFKSVPIVSDVLLMKEQQRQLYQINKQILKNSDVSQYSIHILNVLFPDIWLNANFEHLIEENWTVHNSFLSGDYGSMLPKLFLAWDMLSDNEEIRYLNTDNPYTNSIRIMERGYPIIKETHPKSFQIGYRELIPISLKFFDQDVPYISSNDEDYLNALDDFFLQNKQLPNWLAEDNKRGFVKR